MNEWSRKKDSWTVVVFKTAYVWGETYKHTYCKDLKLSLSDKCLFLEIILQNNRAIILNMSFYS